MYLYFRILALQKSFVLFFHSFSFFSLCHTHIQTNWERLVSLIFADRINEDEDFIVKVPEFIEGVDKLISRTPRR